MDPFGESVGGEDEVSPRRGAQHGGIVARAHDHGASGGAHLFLDTAKKGKLTGFEAHDDSLSKKTLLL
jgi:hypothetical protein